MEESAFHEVEDPHDGTCNAGGQELAWVHVV